MIDHKDMVAVLAKPGAEIAANITANEAHLMHMAVGVAGEAIELVAAMMTSDRDNVVEELGDIEFYFEGLCQGTDIIIMHSTFTRTITPEDSLIDVLIKAGDVLDMTKKIVIYKDQSKLPGLLTEMQSFRTTLDHLYPMAGITHEEALAHNINKLGKRYEGFKYSDGAAKARADKAGE
jgi:phosphoribosyl-ATP pyrophosphohydrolase